MNVKKIVPMEYADLMYQMGFNQALASVKTIIDSIIDDAEQKQMIFDLIEYISYSGKV
jgi:hypothetical protein